MIFNIQRYATHDGPGIRTVVFLKGCSLSCRWCQNPESRSRKFDLFYDERLCLKSCKRCCETFSGCSKVADSITLDRASLQSADMEVIADVCPSGALALCGETTSVDALIQTLLKDKPFYDKSGGGVTLSGGEPLMQPEFAHALLSVCKQHGLNTAIESCLHVPWKYLEPVVELVDMWLVDLKHVDPVKFHTWTNGQLERIEQNIERLGQHGATMIFRVPVIPDFNDDAATLEAIIQQAAGFFDRFGGVRALHFLPYHTYGMHKYHLLGLPYECSPQPLESPELFQFLQTTTTKYQLNMTLRG